MLEAFEVVSKSQMGSSDRSSDMFVTLRYDEREKSRHKTVTDCGEALGWFIPRGHVLEQGEGLKTSSGVVVNVVAAQEEVSCVTSNNPHLLMRAAYHLGNRHVPLQVEVDKLCYLADYVLDDMVRGLGLHIDVLNAPFTPESGAYHSHGEPENHSGQPHGASHHHAGHSHNASGHHRSSDV